MKFKYLFGSAVTQAWLHEMHDDDVMDVLMGAFLGS